MNAIIKDLLIKAIKPKKVKFLIVHSTADVAKAATGKNYTIICEIPSKPLPFTLSQIDALDSEQIIELERMIELRRRKKELVKKESAYTNLLKKINNNKL